MSITLYMAYNTIICTISFGLLESFKITLLEDFILKIIKFKVTEKSKKKAIFRDFGLKYLFEWIFK